MANRENFAYSNGTAALYVMNKKTGVAVQCGVFLVQTPNITFSKLFQKANKRKEDMKGAQSTGNTTVSLPDTITASTST